MINVSELILDPEFNQKITLRISDKFGENFTDKVIDSVVVPVTPQDLLRLPEGERTAPSIKIYTLEPVKLGDRFLFKGSEYRVLVSNDWSDYGVYNSISTKYVGTENDISGGFDVT